MCGSTGAQQQIQAAQSNFYNELTAEHKTDFGEFQSIFGQLTAAFEPILGKGPDQQGFGPEELTALNTEAIDRVAGDVKNAQQFVQGEFGGGDSFVPQGAEEREMRKVATAGVKESADLETQITENDYATGRANYWEAAGALAGAAGMTNPVGSAEVANSAGKDASDTANEIASENNSWMGPVFSAVGGIAGAAIGKIPTGGGGDE